jgi:hypothetical protein
MWMAVINKKLFISGTGQGNHKSQGMNERCISLFCAYREMLGMCMKNCVIEV